MTYDLSRFGLNPFGDPLWRIIHGSTRRTLVHGHGRKPQRMLTYPQAEKFWILEKWLSAFEFAGCTPESWYMDVTAILGPYPHRGEYELAHVFSAVAPADSSLDKLISWLEAGKKYSLNENRNAIRDQEDLAERDRKNQRIARIGNALPAFGAAPMSGPGGGRGTKTMPVRFSANDLKLPTSPGHMLARPTKQKFEVNL